MKILKHLTITNPATSLPKQNKVALPCLVSSVQDTFIRGTFHTLIDCLSLVFLLIVSCLLVAYFISSRFLDVLYISIEFLINSLSLYAIPPIILVYLFYRGYTVVSNNKTRKRHILDWASVGLGVNPLTLAKTSTFYNSVLPPRLPFVNIIIYLLVFCIGNLLPINAYIFTNSVHLTYLDLILIISFIFSLLILCRNAFTIYVLIYIVFSNLPFIKHMFSAKTRSFLFGDVNFFWTMSVQDLSIYIDQVKSKKKNVLIKISTWGYPLGLFLRVLMSIFLNTILFLIFILFSGFNVYLFILYIKNVNHGVPAFTLVDILCEHFNIHFKDTEAIYFNDLYSILSKVLHEYFSLLTNVVSPSKETVYNAKDLVLADSTKSLIDSTVNYYNTKLGSESEMVKLIHYVQVNYGLLGNIVAPFINIGYVIFIPFNYPEAEQVMLSKINYLEENYGMCGNLLVPIINIAYSPFISFTLTVNSEQIVDFVYSYRLSYSFFGRLFHLLDNSGYLILDAYSIYNPDVHNNIYIKIASLVYRVSKHLISIYFIC